MKKLTDFQIENLIETIVKEKKIINKSNIKEYYLNKWNNCKTKKEKFLFFEEIFSERKKMISEGYDSKIIDEGIFSDLFGTGVTGAKSAFKEWIAGKLISALGVSDPGLKNAIAIGLGNLSWKRDWVKLLSPLKNCRYFTDIILDSVIEYYINKGLNNWFGVGSGTVGTVFRNAMSDTLTDSKFVQPIQNSVGNALCGALEKMFGGGSLKDTISKVMSGTQQGAKGQSPSPAPAE